MVGRGGTGGERRVGEGRGGEGKNEKPPPESIATAGAMHKGRIPCRLLVWSQNYC